mmetsp:Transcript_13950/g.59708  ORF Transcript_13950/g.59708 Transcript_13950/m.59708 type:complete len:223 (+) Transcript_13950:3196-3864(+)
MPTPLSRTSNKIWLVWGLFSTARTSTENSTSAVLPSTLLEYLIALSTRLMQHCLRRKKSPTKRVLKCSGLARSITSSTPREDAFCEMSVTCSMSCLIVHTSSDSSMLALDPPLSSLAPSNLAKSRIWLMRPRSASAEVSEALMNAPVKSVSSPDSIARVLKPMMELSGVLNSCVTLKKNALCACDICVAIFCLCSSTRSRQRNEPAEIMSEYENLVSTSLYR